MPKVKPEYVDNKKKEILDAAYRVAMGKPMHEVSMRDIIRACGMSQGAIYRYFSCLDDILIELVNRECPPVDMAKEVEAIISQNSSPEQTMYALIELWRTKVFNCWIGVGKIFSELTAMYTNDHEKLLKFRRGVQLGLQEAVFQEKSFAWMMEKIEEGIFQPQLPLSDIIIFMSAAFDGMIRDMILVKHYHLGDLYPPMASLRGDRMIYSVYLAVHALLGSPEEPIPFKGDSNEIE